MPDEATRDDEGETMSRFYGSMQGTRGEATRCGTAASGLDAHIRGWTAGVRTIARADADGLDRFDIYATSGSNGGAADVLIGWVTVGEDGARFFPFVRESLDIVDDDPAIDDEPAWGSFPDERGYPDLDGAPYAQARDEVRARADQ